MSEFGVEDIFVIEDPEGNEDDYYPSIQRAINSLSAWRFQGSMGRAMMDAIEGGACMLGHEDTTDYYGNHIPSRHQVEEGTKGSFQFVADRHGQEYAERMAAL